MNGIGVAFVIVPCLAAIVIGWGARHWTLAAAAIAGGAGWLFLVPILPGDLRFLTPFFTGAIVAGLTLLPALIWRPEMTVWSRMTLALAVTFAVHFLFLQFAMATR